MELLRFCTTFVICCVSVSFSGAQSPCGTCNTEGLPRTYNAYHLDGKTINIDGRLDDDAWAEVPWTGNFVDIRGPKYPKPHLDTQVKVRWDDDRLYIGARMEETDFWGDVTVDDSSVWQQNAFEVYVVADGSLHNYKELEINVLNTTFDLMLKMAYSDNKCYVNGDVAVSDWSGQLVKSTYTDGMINDPTGNGTFWTAEFSVSFAALAEHTIRNESSPHDQEAWFFIFARPEYKFKIMDGTYQKDETRDPDWWAWQPMYAVNLHLPSRFGLVQFKRNRQDTEFIFNKWHIYRALFAIFEAERKYKSTNGAFVSDIHELDIPDIASSRCVTTEITLTGEDFDAAVTSKIDDTLPTGHIRDDRYVWFT